MEKTKYKNTKFIKIQKNQHNMEKTKHKNRKFIKIQKKHKKTKISLTNKTENH